MNIERYILDSYPAAGPFEGINSVESRLLNNCYLVVIDDERKFYGILTPNDIIERPHKLVIDSIVKKESISVNDTILTVIEKFRITHCFALPVFNDNEFIGVIEKDRILNDYEHKINELYNKALISGKAKSSFLENLSHEIRTPLNGILGFIDIITNLNIDDIQYEGISGIIRRSADRFLLIMNDLIELSLFNAGDQMIISKNEVRIEEIFEELKEYFSELTSLQNKPSTVVFLNPDHNQTLFTDKKKLKHILFHLIDNGIKFSHNNKALCGYELSKDKNDIEFFVKNESEKIPDEIRINMFNFFEKQDTIGEKLNSGLGIGLPLVKKITEALGGKLRMELLKKEVTCFVNLSVR